MSGAEIYNKGSLNLIVTDSPLQKGKLSQRKISSSDASFELATIPGLQLLRLHSGFKYLVKVDMAEKSSKEDPAAGGRIIRSLGDV